MIREIVNTPAPKEFERKNLFTERFLTHPTVIKSYSTLLKRRLAAERRWAKAKGESVVSIVTEGGEVLLF